MSKMNWTKTWTHGKSCLFSACIVFVIKVCYVVPLFFRKESVISVCSSSTGSCKESSLDVCKKKVRPNHLSIGSNNRRNNSTSVSYLFIQVCTTSTLFVCVYCTTGMFCFMKVKCVNFFRCNFVAKIV